VIERTVSAARSEVAAVSTLVSWRWHNVDHFDSGGHWRFDDPVAVKGRRQHLEIKE